MYSMCLEAGECWPGLLECHGIPLLVSILLPPVGFSMQLLDQAHYPYISTGLVENIFTLTQYRIATYIMLAV